MSDFSELCPLFNTGVYSEVTFPYVNLAAVSTTEGTGGYIFGRSVIVTAAYTCKHTTLATSTDAFKIKLAKAATFGAVLTVFASYQVSKTVTTQTVGRYRALTVTAKTFGATDCLLMTTDGAEANCKLHSIIVRYKEK